MAEHSIGFEMDESLEFRTTGWVVNQNAITAPAAGIPEGKIPERWPEHGCNIPESLPEHNWVPGRNCEIPVMVSIAAQPWGEPYDVETGMTRGTIFPALDLPFIGGGACRHG